MKFALRILRHGIRFRNDRGGGLAITAALVAPVAVMAVGVTVEYGNAVMQRSQLQQVADAAALASARELRMSNTNAGAVQSVANSVVQASLAGSPAQSQTQASISVLNGGSGVEVIVTRTSPALFSSLVSSGQTSVSARSVARLSGGAPLCVFALETTSVTAIDASGTAKMTAKGCALYSNSPSSKGVSIRNQASFTAGSICSAGGVYRDAGTQAIPQPTSDCKSQDDPLAGRAIDASSGSCNNTSSYQNGTFTLSPGRYCNGIKIEGHATVHLSEGTYYIESGDLTVQDGSKLDGTKVAFVFGQNSRLNIESDSSDIRLSAPTTGSLAGLLFYDKFGGSSGSTKNHYIRSSNVKKLLGTIYFPKSRLNISGAASVADESAFTIILAGQIMLSSGPNLVLNSDYSATDVPVPDGTGNSSVMLNN